jgi:hypothetical protein
MVRPSLLESDASGWFDLSGPVGLRVGAARADAIRLEGILANSGDLDLGERGGPTGYWGLAQDKALRGYQRRNGLAVDGWASPDGETIAHMRDAFGSLLGGYGVPTPEDVDAHHEDLAAGGRGLIATVPRIARASMPGLADIGAAGRASNAAQIDWLSGNRTGFAGVPEQLARYVREQGDIGLAQAQDFLGQFGQRRPGEADALLAGLLGRLPERDLRARLLGVAPGALPPVGVRVAPDRRTLELRRDEMEPGPEAYMKPVHRWEDDDKPGIRLLAAESADAENTGTDTVSDPQVAQAGPRSPGPDRAAIREDIDAFVKSATGKQYVGENAECVSLVKSAIPTLGATAGWRAGDAITAPNDPPLQPGTAVATFHPDPKSGEPRYRSEPTGNHAGIFLRYGEKGGRSGMYLFDQSRDIPARESFYPFERAPKERGYAAGQFSVIRPRDAK